MNKKLKDSFYGLIPDDWNSETFQDCLTGFSSGSTPSRDNPNYFNGNINWITSGELNYNIIYQTKECVTEEAIVKSNLKILPKGTFLIAITGLEAEKVRGACGIVGINSVSNQSCMALYPKEEKIFTNYLFYFYSFFGAKLAFQFCQGTKQQSYNAQLVKILPIIYPSLKEQNAIANCLSTWDEAIEKQQKLIEAKEIRHKALMQKLLSGKKRLPGFTDEWKEVKLGDVCVFKNGKAHESIIDDSGDYILINSKFISTNGKVQKRVSKDLSPLKLNDLVFVMSDVPNGKALAKFFYVSQDNLYSLNQRIGLLRVKNGISKFYFYLLNRNRYFLEFDNGVGQTNLKKDDILDCPLLIPTIKEQEAIAYLIETSDSEIKLEQGILDQLREQKKALMQKLLTGKVRLPLQN